MEEVWKDIKGYEGLYQVSSLGNVKRLPTTITMRNQYTSWEQKEPEYMFTPSCNTDGYPQVVLSAKGVPKRTARVHRLVAEAFLEPPSKLLQDECLKTQRDYVLVNHKDNNKLNACVENLEWCSPSYNNLWCVYQGRNNRDSIKGESNHCSVLTESDVLEIVDLLKHKQFSQEKIASLYNIKQITVSNLWTGRSWSWLTGISYTPRVKRKRKTNGLIPTSISESVITC